MAAREPSPDAEKPRRKSRRKKAFVAGFFGVGLDSKDGHTRLTKGKHFVLLGGSPETHEQMQEFAVKLNERMKKAGRAFGQVSPGELRELADGL